MLPAKLPFPSIADLEEAEPRHVLQVLQAVAVQQYPEYNIYITYKVRTQVSRKKNSFSNGLLRLVVTFFSEIFFRA